MKPLQRKHTRALTHTQGGQREGETKNEKYPTFNARVYLHVCVCVYFKFQEVNVINKKNHHRNHKLLYKLEMCWLQNYCYAGRQLFQTPNWYFYNAKKEQRSFILHFFQFRLYIFCSLYYLSFYCRFCYSFIWLVSFSVFILLQNRAHRVINCKCNNQVSFRTTTPTTTATS